MVEMYAKLTEQSSQPHSTAICTIVNKLLGAQYI